MQYKLLALDIDGTLRPHGCDCVPRENVQALRAIQAAGVKVAISTGRNMNGIPKRLLKGVRPDFWVCSAGAQVGDHNREEFFSQRMSSEEMYALVDFFEDYELPLAFDFSDGNYAYTGYADMMARMNGIPGSSRVVDGEDQDRHLEDMPYKGFGILPQELHAKFQEKYGYLNLHFYYFAGDYCDIVCDGRDKAVGLAALGERCGISLAEMVAVGDSPNDIGMLKAVGLGACVASGSEDAKAAADRVILPAEQNAVAALCRELWPEAFEKALEKAGAQ